MQVRTHEQDSMVAKPASSLGKRSHDARQHGCRGTGHVIIEARELGAVHIEQLTGVVVRHLLKLTATDGNHSKEQGISQRESKRTKVGTDLMKASDTVYILLSISFRMKVNASIIQVLIIRC